MRNYDINLCTLRNWTEYYSRVCQPVLISLSCYWQPWQDVSDTAKDFIDSLLVINPEKRLTAEAALKHQWIASNAALSSQKNLHGSFTENWRKHSASRNGSARSNRSQRSSTSSKSRRSSHTQKGIVGTLPQEGLVPVTNGDVQARKGQSSEKGPATKHASVKVSKQLLEECQAGISESGSKLPISATEVMAHSNHVTATSNTALLSIQEISQEEVGQDPTKEFSMPAALESRHFKKGVQFECGVSSQYQGPSSADLQLSSSTMRDNFFSNGEFGNTEELCSPASPELASVKVAPLRGSTADGNSTSPRSRVHSVSTSLPRTNKVSCSEVAKHPP